MIKVYEGSSASDYLTALTKPFNSPGTVDSATGAEKQRAVEENSARQKVEDVVKKFIEIVRTKGDRGILEIAIKLKDIAADQEPASVSDDGSNNRERNRFRLSEEAIAKAVKLVDQPARKTLELAASRIREFGTAVVNSVKSVEVDCGEFQTGIDHRPVRRVACYVPAGRYPLPSTALMTAVTAQVAGVEEIVIVSPRLEKEIIYAGTIAGVTEFYEIGGAQAVAAMAFGTDTIEPADMIVGPGNAYVTEAKRQLQGVIGIDMLAGPSEICVIADDNANPEWLSLDLLSQAEHDPDARAFLLTTNSKLADEVAKRIADDVKRLCLPDFLSLSLAGSAILVLDSIQSCCDAANKIAPEHLLLAVGSPEELKARLTNYGALFLGYGCTVAFGDYMAGPNHTLPTNRSAKFQGCLSPLTFLRAQSWIRVKTQAPSLAVNTAEFADIEGLTAHAAAAKARAACSAAK